MNDAQLLKMMQLINAAMEIANFQAETIAAWNELASRDLTNGEVLQKTKLDNQKLSADIKQGIKDYNDLQG